VEVRPVGSDRELVTLVDPNGDLGATQVLEAPTSDVSRSPADLLRCAVAAVLLAALLIVQWLFGDTLVTFAADVLRGLEALPGWMVDVIAVGTRLLALVVLGGGLVVALRRGRWRMLLTAGVALAAGIVLVALFAQFAPSPGAAVVDVSDGLGPLSSDSFPTAAGVVGMSAVLTAAAPWLSRRWRRLSWTLLVGLVVTRFLVSPVSFDSVRAALTGWLVGAAVLVFFGGPSRRPSGPAIAAGLSDVGLPLQRLEQASVDARGSTPYFATAADGGALFVKALGQDQRSADLLFRMYRLVTPRDLGDERPFSSLRRTVEHEALLALAARDLDIRTPRLRAFATAEPHSFVLAYEAIEGKSLDRVEASDVTDEVLTAIWDEVLRLRHHRIAHRDLRLANIFLGTDATVWIIDFGFSELAASDLLLANDTAELIASSTLQVGPERAVAAARTALPPASLALALRRLHPWSLSGATRTGLKENPGLLGEIRDEVARAAEEGAPAAPPP
jgi:undecaprenyl-diphosphatase